MDITKGYEFSSDGPCCTTCAPGTIAPSPVTGLDAASKLKIHPLSGCASTVEVERGRQLRRPYSSLSHFRGIFFCLFLCQLKSISCWRLWFSTRRFLKRARFAWVYEFFHSASSFCRPPPRNRYARPI